MVKLFSKGIDRQQLISRVALGAFGVMLIVVAFTLLFGIDNTDSGASGTTITNSSTTVVADPVDTRADRIELIQEFVAEQRGLAFLAVPEVEFLTEEAFTAALDKHLDQTLDLDALAESTEVFRALGLIPVGVEVSESIREYLRLRTVGYFDSDTGLVRLRGDELTPMTELVLVHELTHALDDQHFGVDSAKFSDRDDESQLAFQALVEGSADLVESAWLAELSEAEFAQLASERSALPIAPALPDAVLTALSFAHVSGEPFAQVLVAEGGSDLLNASFMRPPRTSEQILELQLPGTEEVVSEIAPPLADGEVVSVGSLGALTLRLLLERVIPYGDAWNLSLLWGGDSYVLWHSHTAACVRVDFVAETQEGQARLETALQQVASNRAGTASVESVDGVTRFTGCG